jgi:hypothetical protein
MSNYLVGSEPIVPTIFINHKVEESPMNKNKHQTILAILFAAGLFCTEALAMTISLKPISETIKPGLGEKAYVGLEISDLGDRALPTLGAFGVEIAFNPSILSFDAAAYGTYLGDPNNTAATDIATSTKPGSIFLDEFSFLSASQLDPLQPANFRLAEFTFSGKKLGTSPLDIKFVDLSDAKGNTLTPASIKGATVDVVPIATAVVPQFGVIKVNSEWQQVNLNNAASAVILAGPPTYNGGDPGVVRLSAKTDSGFQARFREWDYRELDFGDTSHVDEFVSYLALPEGRQNMADGSIWEVGTFELEGTDEWETISFDEPFAQTPYIFVTIQTANGFQAVTARVRNVDSTQFEVAFFEEEFLMESGHVNETVGYVAVTHPEQIADGSGIGGYLMFGKRKVPYYLERIRAKHNFQDAVGTRIKLEEEQSLDDETLHVKENIDVLTLGTQVFAQQVSDNGKDTTAIRRQLGIERLRLVNE